MKNTLSQRLRAALLTLTSWFRSSPAPIHSTATSSRYRNRAAFLSVSMPLCHTQKRHRRAR